MCIAEEERFPATLEEWLPYRLMLSAQPFASSLLRILTSNLFACFLRRLASFGCAE
jgi:hypothetical protein